MLTSGYDPASLGEPGFVMLIGLNQTFRISPARDNSNESGKPSCTV